MHFGRYGTFWLQVTMSDMCYRPYSVMCLLAGHQVLNKDNAFLCSDCGDVIHCLVNEKARCCSYKFQRM